jgi:3-oxoadipate enol-lactonase
VSTSGRTRGGIAYDRGGPTGELPVVLLHAGVADRRMWEPVWAALTSVRDVLRLDLRSFGDSAEKVPGPVSHRGDVVATLTELGVGRAHLVGASMGSGVAVETALVRPDLVASLMLAPPGGSLIVERTADLRAFVDAEDAALEAGDVPAAVQANIDTWVIGPGRTAGSVDPDVIAHVRAMQAEVFEIGLDWGDDYQEAELDPMPRLGEIDVPTLVLLGGHDLDAITDAARRLGEGIRGSRRVDWHDVAHLPSMERPADFAALLLDWVGR